MRIALAVLPDVFDADIASCAELQHAASGRHNLLLEGPTDWTDAVLRHLTPLLLAPVIRTTPQALRTLPEGTCGTLVVQDVAALSREDQAALFEWLEDGRGQVISTSVQPLFSALAQGGFDEALYYRLNVIRMCDSSLVPFNRCSPETWSLS